MGENIYFRTYKRETLQLKRYKQLETTNEKQYGIICKGDNMGYATKTNKGWIMTIDGVNETYYVRNLQEMEKMLANKLLKAFE